MTFFPDWLRNNTPKLALRLKEAVSQGILPFLNKTKLQHLYLFRNQYSKHQEKEILQVLKEEQAGARNGLLEQVMVCSSPF